MTDPARPIPCPAIPKATIHDAKAAPADRHTIPPMSSGNPFPQHKSVVVARNRREANRLNLHTK